MVFLTSSFSCSLLVYWKAVDFGTLTLYGTTLIYLLINSKSFGFIPLDFLFWQPYHLWSSVLYLSSQPVCLFFSCHVEWARTCVLCSQVWWEQTSCLRDFRGSTSLSPLTLKWVGIDSRFLLQHSRTQTSSDLLYWLSGQNLFITSSI